MTDAMAVLKRNFLPQELKPLLAENGFHGSIAVQARQSLEETRWLLELAGQYDFIKGVVGWVDLCAAELPLQLKYFAAHKRLVGVRHLVQDETDDEFMMRADFRRGIAQLADFGLTYDLLLYPRHLPVAAKLVREFPDQRFVLDHIAKPAIAEGRIDDWERELAGAGKVPERLMQIVRDGHGGALESLAAGRFPAVSGCRFRRIWSQPVDDWVGLAGVHAVGGLRFSSVYRDELY